MSHGCPYHMYIPTCGAYRLLLLRRRTVIILFYQPSLRVVLIPQGIPVCVFCLLQVPVPLFIFIYRTRDNRAFCQKHGIQLSGPKLGRPSKETTKTDKQVEYQDNTDRIEVERRFSLTKRCYEMSKIVTRLEDTQLTSIALSVFVANIVRMQQRILSALFYLLDILKFRESWLPAYAG